MRKKQRQIAERQNVRESEQESLINRDRDRKRERESE